MADYTLQAQKRTETKKQVQGLRENGVIPGIVYGGKENILVKFNRGDFTKLYKEAGESTIVDLVLDDGNTIPVLIQDTQKHPVRGDFEHVDFYEIDMNKKLTAHVELKFIGVAPAVKQLGGILVMNLNEVEIRCLPADLIHTIEVDLSELKEFDDSIHVSDLKVPDNIEIVTAGEILVAKVAEPKVESETKAESEESTEDEATTKTEETAEAEVDKKESEEKS